MDIYIVYSCQDYVLNILKDSIWIVLEQVWMEQNILSICPNHHKHSLALLPNIYALILTWSI